MIDKKMIVENNMSFDDIIDNCNSEDELKFVLGCDGDIEKLLDNL